MGIQSVITRTVTVAGGRFAPGHLGELTQLVPFEMVDEALAQTKTVQSRVRDVPSRVVVYLLLAGCLFPELGYLGVWGKLTAGLAGVPVAAPTAGALAQDRRRVGERRCGGYSICCAARPPSRAGTACGGTGCWYARSMAPP